MSMVYVVNTRKRPLVKLEDRVAEYVRRRGERRINGLEHG